MNVIPGTLELAFNWRYSTESTRESLITRLREVLDRRGLDYAVRFLPDGKPFLTPRGRLVEVVSEAVRESTGVTPELSCTGGTSDGRFIASIARELVELGPVGATIHQVDERVAIDDLERLSAIYRAVLGRLLVPGRAG